MTIDRIQATKDAIVLYGDISGTLTVIESAPTVSSDARTVYRQTSVEADGGRLTIDRFLDGRDSIFSRFTAVSGGRKVPGVRYVTEVAPSVPADTSEYPQPDTIKTLGASPDLIKELGIRQGLVNINLPNIMTARAGGGAIDYELNGRTYHFIREAVETIDRYVSSFPMTTMILLNSPRLFGSTGETELLDACIHPDYDWNCNNAYISAFDMQRDEGQGYYAAFVSFLCERYTRPDGRYGRAVGAIISNEVNSQYVWGNAGDKSVSDYTEEYAEALRLAWLCGQRYCRHFRVYISLDQFFCGSNFDPTQKTRYYSGREMLELLEDICRRDGDFPWHVAYHPYPEDLRWADFWNDRCPDFTFSTPKITFKNMEVLEAFLAQDKFLYKGKPRRIIFSEQGFNSMSGPLQGHTERNAAAGYVLAYMKARNMKTVDMFTHHSFTDNPHEFGLNLGMFRYDPDKPYHRGEAKPIFESFKAMDTPDEAEAVRKARDRIGHDLFDYLLDPPVEHGDRKPSTEPEFG